MLSSDNSRRILLEGLPLRCNSRDLQYHFSSFGPLTECIAMTNKKTGHCRGFGFVSFIWGQHCKLCLEKQTHSIKGTKITLRPLDDEVTEFEQSLPARRLLVSFVGKRLRKFDLLDYFSKFGSVSVELGNDGEKQAFFAFVIFNDEEMCRNCMRIAEHFIAGHQVHIRSVVRKEVYKRAEQAERERIAREERCKAEEVERLQMQMVFKGLSSKVAESLSKNYYSPVLPHQLQSFLVPPPPPPFPPPHPEPLASSSTVPSYSNNAPTQSQPSHSWVPLLPASSNNACSAVNDGSMASLLAGYGGRQTREAVQPQKSVTTPENFSRNTRSTWARLADFSVHNNASSSSYTSSPRYYYNT